MIFSEKLGNEPVEEAFVEVDGETELLVVDDGAGVFRLGVFVLGFARLRHERTTNSLARSVEE